jgi:hypothetical protein
MKIDFSQLILSLEGQPTQYADTSGAQAPMTLKIAAVVALQAQFHGEDLSGIDKMKRFSIALKIFNATAPVLLKSDEIELVKQCVAKGWPISVVGRVWPMLDPAEAVA